MKFNQRGLRALERRARHLARRVDAVHAGVETKLSSHTYDLRELEALRSAIPLYRAEMTARTAAMLEDVPFVATAALLEQAAHYLDTLMELVPDGHEAITRLAFRVAVQLKERAVSYEPQT